MAQNGGIRGNYHFFAILRHIINSPAVGSVGRKRSEKEETDMEISYTYLRSKEVVNLTDGKRLGRVCDVVFRYPENVFLGIVVPGNKGFSFKKGDVFIDVKCISCIGEDVILVRAEGLRRAGKSRGKVCPPQGAPSARQGVPCMPGEGTPGGFAPPLYPPAPTYAPAPRGDGRRSFDEYE